MEKPAPFFKEFSRLPVQNQLELGKMFAKHPSLFSYMRELFEQKRGAIKAGDREKLRKILASEKKEINRLTKRLKDEGKV